MLLKSTMVIFFIFHFTRKQQKQQLASSFTQCTVLCTKTLIMACAYVGFLPVIKVTQQQISKHSYSLASIRIFLIPVIYLFSWQCVFFWLPYDFLFLLSCNPTILQCYEINNTRMYVDYVPILNYIVINFISLWCCIKTSPQPSKDRHIMANGRQK